MHSLSSYQKTEIPTTLRPGKAVGEGDSFFDAVAQCLNEMDPKYKVTIKSLRLLSHQHYLQLENQSDNWIKEALIKKDKRTGKCDEAIYHDYQNVQYTALERKEGKGTGPEGNKLAIWGKSDIDGRIFCEKLNIKIHIIEVHNDGQVSHQLVDAISSKRTEIETSKYKEPNLIHLVGNLPRTRNVQSLEDDTYWYDDRDLDDLLKKQLQDGTEAFIASACYPFQIISGEDNIQPAKIFKNVLLEALVRSIPTVVPISNLENALLDPNGLAGSAVLGSHWIGMVIFPNPDPEAFYKPTILYIDPCGHSDNKDYRVTSTTTFDLKQCSPFTQDREIHRSRIFRLVELFNGINLNAELIVTGLQQQSDGASCGPLCVHNLVIVVKNKLKTLSSTSIPDVEALRRKDKRLRYPTTGTHFVPLLKTEKINVLGEEFYNQGLSYARNGRLTEAYEYFKKSYDKGYKKAATRLSVYFEQGLGVTQDIKKALALLNDAAKNGHHDNAQYNLGRFYRVHEEDRLLAFYWYAVTRNTCQVAEKDPTEIKILEKVEEMENDSYEWMKSLSKSIPDSYPEAKSDDHIQGELRLAGFYADTGDLSRAEFWQKRATKSKMKALEEDTTLLPSQGIVRSDAIDIPIPSLKTLRGEVGSGFIEIPAASSDADWDTSRPHIPSLIASSKLGASNYSSSSTKMPPPLLPVPPLPHDELDTKPPTTSASSSKTVYPSSHSLFPLPASSTAQTLDVSSKSMGFLPKSKVLYTLSPAKPIEPKNPTPETLKDILKQAGLEKKLVSGYGNCLFQAIIFSYHISTYGNPAEKSDHPLVWIKKNWNILCGDNDGTPSIDITALQNNGMDKEEIISLLERKLGCHIIIMSSSKVERIKFEFEDENPPVFIHRGPHYHYCLFSKIDSLEEIHSRSKNLKENLMNFFLKQEDMTVESPGEGTRLFEAIAASMGLTTVNFKTYLREQMARNGYTGQEIAKLLQKFLRNTPENSESTIKYLEIFLDRFIYINDNISSQEDGRKQNPPLYIYYNEIHHRYIVNRVMTHTDHLDNHRTNSLSSRPTVG